jgi:lysophospholipase L1-like esterase
MRAIPRRVLAILRWLRTAWLILGITLVLIVALELGLRAVFWLKDRSKPRIPPDPRVVAALPESGAWLDLHYRELETLSDRWQPFVYFRQRPFRGQTVTVDEEGLRATWQPPRSRAENGPAGSPLKILMLGGSSLWGFGARDDWTIPSLVSKSLYRRGVRADVRNLAEIGYVNTQEMIALLRELEEGYRPDIVVFYDGVNDATSALLERQASVSTNETNRVREFNLLQSAPRLVTALLGNLVRNSAMFRLASSLRGRFAKGQSQEFALPSREDSHRLAYEVVRGYGANVKLIETLGKAYGFRALFVWQPVIFFKKSLVPFEEEERAKYNWTAAMFQDVQAMIAQEVQLTSDAAFINLSEIFKDTESLVFLDFCHTTEEANAKIAVEIVPRLIETGTKAASTVAAGRGSSR